MTALTIIRRDESGFHSVYTRSDGEVFHLRWLGDGYASLTHNDAEPPNGIGFGKSVGDKYAAAAKRILEYPDGWPRSI